MVKLIDNKYPHRYFNIKMVIVHGIACKKRKNGYCFNSILTEFVKLMYRNIGITWHEFMLKRHTIHDTIIYKCSRKKRFTNEKTT
jgi:hypothetical protein